MGLDPRVVKKSDMGLAGAILVLAQALSTYHSTQILSSELDDLKDSIHVMKSDQEKYFVKKEELKRVVIQLDNVNNQLVRLNAQIKSIRQASFVDDYDQNNQGIVGCVFHTIPEKGEI